MLRYSQYLWKHKNYTSTIANVWLPHNLSDIARIVNNYLSTGEINYEDIAPNFPTGGIIINKKDLPVIYKTGKGKVILRGRAEIKGNSILITEIPYQVYVEPFIAQIKELIQKDELTGISNILNKSDKKKLLIEIECDENPASVLNKLYRKTNLQKSYSANQFALVGKTPELLNLKQYLDIYLQHNYDCIQREYEFDLTKAKARLEIVTGLIKALEDIDNIISLIKSSESATAACQNLIKKYSFTDRQAKAIVDMKLGRLAHLEKIELNNEKEELTSTVEKCEEIINSVNKRKEIYLERFNAFVKKYGKEGRKTELMQIDIKPEEKEIAEVTPVDVVVVTTESGLIKKVPVSNFRVQRKGGKGVKTADDAIMSTIKTNTVDYMMFFTDAGRMYRTVVDNIPDGTNATKGVPIASLVQLGNNEKVIAVTSLHRKSIPQFAIFVTKQGMFKKSFLTEYLGAKRNAGIAAIKLREGDSVASVIFQDTEDIVLITKNGMSIKFDTASIGAVGRNTQGVIGIKLSEGDFVIRALPIHKEGDNLAIVNEDGMGKKILLSDLPKQNRGGKGTYISKKNVADAALIDDEDILLINGINSSICISSKDFPLLSKNADGNILIKNNHIVRIAKI